MKTMVLDHVGGPLTWAKCPDRQPGPNEVLIKISACGVRRTDLHVLDGELPHNPFPIIPGHEIIGRIDVLGSQLQNLKLGERVGASWLGHTSSTCPYCINGRQNMFDTHVFTGYTRDGGFATSVIVDAHYAFAMGERGSDQSLAPFLCAGLIGWRALAIAGEGSSLGFLGFGAAAHILAQVARWQDRSLVAFARPGDRKTQEFARSLGASWSGGSDELPPQPLDAAIILAAAGDLILVALRAVCKGRRVVCAGIHMPDIVGFPYRDLWEKRQLLSVANLTRQDRFDFLKLALQIGIVTQTTPYPLQQANRALAD